MGYSRHYQGNALLIFKTFFSETCVCQMILVVSLNQISEEEIGFLTKGEDPYDDNVVRKLYHSNLKLLLVTEGPDGCRYYTKVCI